MQIYLLRHGIAEDARPGHSDAKRALTKEGGERVAEVIKAARRAGAEPSLIVSSPFVRAVETARIAAEGLGYKGNIVRWKPWFRTALRKASGRNCASTAAKRRFCWQDTSRCSANSWRSAGLAGVARGNEESSARPGGSGQLRPLASRDAPLGDYTETRVAARGRSPDRLNACPTVFLNC